MRGPAVLAKIALALACASLSCGSGPGGHAPIALLDAPSTCDLGSTMVLNASLSVDLDGDIVLYRFLISDGSPAREETQPRIEHVCRVAGLIEVALEVVDSAGHSGWASTIVSVRRP